MRVGTFRLRPSSSPDVAACNRSAAGAANGDHLVAKDEALLRGIVACHCSAMPRERRLDLIRPPFDTPECRKLEQLSRSSQRTIVVSIAGRASSAAAREKRSPVPLCLTQCSAPPPESMLSPIRFPYSDLMAIGGVTYVAALLSQPYRQSLPLFCRFGVSADADALANGFWRRMHSRYW